MKLHGAGMIENIGYAFSFFFFLVCVYSMCVSFMGNYLYFRDEITP